MSEETKNQTSWVREDILKEQAEADKKAKAEPKTTTTEKGDEQ
jgi:hypothetical protein